MPPATPRTPDRQPPERAAPSAGFSLTEVLVTLSIIAFVSAMIVATARPADPLRREGERLSQTLAQLHNRARATGAPAGLVLDADAYTSVRWSDGAWFTLPAGRHALRGVIIVSPAPAAQALGQDDQGALRPQIIFDPLGHSALV
ncbi:MAG: prepilin-type N-terminal cleavage/methylation domain-containing protein, partial [Hyphomonas sp.]|uniref:prepilin-type N-terminal cleavage/methylation domain-containing protein n=1 Tax=Hyphomonas sp. TaxID=87 RepID=UPI0034A03964